MAGISLSDQNKETLSEFPIGTKVTCRFMPGSEGLVIEHELCEFTILSPRFKVRWTRHQYLPEGETEESGWLSSRELRVL